MADKPRFDPSQPFEVPSAEKPKFDPSKPFEPADEESFATTAGKALYSGAAGVAEAMNPLAAPRGLETLGRAFFEEADPNKGFFGRVSERLQKADEKAVLPRMNVDQVAAGVRTAISPIDLYSKGPIEGIKDAYQKQLDIQTRGQEQAIIPGVKAGAEVATSLANLGLLARDAAKAVGLTKKAGEAAKLKSFEALKPKGKLPQKLIAEGRAKEIGDQLLKDKIISPGVSWSSMAKKIKTKLNQYGETIGYYSKTADKALSQDSSVRGVIVDELATDIKSKVIEPLMGDPNTIQTAKEIQNWVDSLPVSAKGLPEVGFQIAQQWKTNLGKTKAKFQAVNDTLTSDAFQDVYHLLNRRIESGIEVALKSQMPSALKDFKVAKEGFRNLSYAEDFIDATVSAQSKNRFLSPSDYFAGLAGLVGGSSAAGPAGLSVAIPAAAANHLARTRGNQTLASFYKTIENLGESKLLNTPNNFARSLEALGLINAATKQPETKQAK